MNNKQLNDYLLSHENVSLTYPYGKDRAVYSVNDQMFAILEVDKEPPRISMLCEPKLAALLREKYDEVMPGYKLHKSKWITVVITGQLNADEIKDLIRLAYQMAIKNIAT